MFSGPFGQDWNLIVCMELEDDSQNYSHVIIYSEEKKKLMTTNGFDFKAITTQRPGYGIIGC